MRFGYGEYVNRVVKLTGSSLSAKEVKKRYGNWNPYQTPSEIEDKVVKLKNKTRLGPKRLSRHLKKHEDIGVPAGTIRHILARNKHLLTYKIKSKMLTQDLSSLLTQKRNPGLTDFVSTFG